MHWPQAIHAGKARLLVGRGVLWYRESRASQILFLLGSSYRRHTRCFGVIRQYNYIQGLSTFLRSVFHEFLPLAK